ncbi:MAG: hypothetical protein HY459_04610 [Parcubacteria group bacterium]|nr:hypothetical protein [Parcubacteria group bacterium]
MRKFDLSAILTEAELNAMQAVLQAEKPIEDPTVLVTLFQTVERLAKRIHDMGLNQEDAAQAILDHLSLQRSTAEYDHGLNVLKGIADDLLFDPTS